MSTDVWISVPFENMQRLNAAISAAHDAAQESRLAATTQRQHAAASEVLLNLHLATRQYLLIGEASLAYEKAQKALRSLS